MRVLHVIPSVSVHNGGPSHAIPGMCRALVRHGQQVTLFTTNIDGPGDMDVPLGSPVDMDGVEVRYFQIQCPRSYSFSFPMAQALKQELKRFDLVHIHSILNWPITPAAHFCRKYDVPYIVRPCGILDPVPLKKAYGSGWLPAGIDLKRRYLRRQYLKVRYLKSIYQRRHYLKKALYLLVVEKRNLEGAAAIHFTSNEETRATEPYSIGAPGFVVPLGVDLNATGPNSSSGEFRNRYGLHGKKIILFLSRLDSKKGLDLLIPALSSLMTRREDFVFVLAGSGHPSYEEEIRIRLQQYGMAGRTILTGFLEGHAKWSLLSEADIFVLPSYHENFGLAVVEAMSVGLPIVITDKVGIHEEVSRERAGFVVSENREELSRAVAALLDSATLRETMGRAGRLLAETKFSWEHGASELGRIYEDILNHTWHSPAWTRQRCNGARPR